jgi:hypothetical protein
MPVRFAMWSALTLSTLLLALPATATASAGDTVAVLHFAQERLAVRIAAELRSQGFSPVTIASDAPVERAEIRRTARELKAVAAIRIAEPGDSVSVWVGDPSEDLVVLQEVYVPLEKEEAATLLAFKAVELVRASLMTLPKKHIPKAAASTGTDKRASSTARGGEAVRSAATVAAKPKKVDRLSLDIQPAITYGFGELPPTLHIGVGARIKVWHRLGVKLLGLIPSLSMEIEAEQGTADVRSGWVAAGVDAGLLPPDKRVAVSVGGLAGPLFLRMKGHANQPYVSKTDLVVVTVLGLTTGVAFMVGEIVSVRGDLLVGFAVPKPEVRILDRNVTDWGRPLLTGLLGIEVWLF